MKYRAVKGMNDILPSEMPKWLRVEETARSHFALYGYAEIRTPIVEQASLFQRGVGEETDIVKKEMYTFDDRDETSISLRPEATASTIRAAIEHHLIDPNAPELKVYYIGPMYRCERPQKGRFRQFHQIGVENFGSESPLADAEVIEMTASFLKKLGVEGWSLNLSSLGKGDERKKYETALRHFLEKNKKDFCEDCRERIDRNPLRVLDCKNESCQKLFSGHPPILDFLGNESRDHFAAVQKTLTAAGVPFKVDPTIVRGLDYYQRTVFEFTSDKIGAKSAIAAGGRYDSLVKDLGGPDIPGTGLAIGMERLLMLCPEAAKDEGKKVFIATLGEKARETASGLAREIRAAGIPCEMEYAERSLKSQLRKADKGSFPYVVILGEEELKKGEVQLKNFRNKSEDRVRLENLTSRLRDL